MKKNYEPKGIEKKIYENWESSGYFIASPDEKKKPFCIMIPPPNVTGTLHMGHGFQNTLMDALIRHKRMSGFDVLWQVGVDHAGIATQMVVERQLESEGKDKESIGRDAFEKRVWEWKEKSGGTITQQLRRLGASVDWSREAFTMNEDLSEAVKEVFVSLYDEGLIYRGERLVNWDVVLQTALSDLEVSAEEESGSLWYFDYPIENGNAITVATTRPETMLGDTAVAVNPNDERFKGLIGKFVKLPITNRKIPIIKDSYVDEEFGTGCVKITPAHDFNDFEIGKRHDLEFINILNLDGTLNQSVPENFRGLTTAKAREKVLKEMDSLGLLNKVEPHKIQIPKSQRSDSILEPLMTKQWFVDVEMISKEAIRVVKENETEFIPKNWENTYFSWMDNIQDWCISRQLWWGHRIPAWFDEEENVYVGKSEDEVRKKYDLKDIELQQDSDVLDTWFSSALWTFSTLGWPKKKNLLSRYHPTSVLVTGFDIIFFWVARMIMMTTHFISEVPFKKILIHGLIKDSEGVKMSKSKGNTLDPLDIIDGINLTDLSKKRTEGLMQPQMKDKIEKQTKKDFPDGIHAYGTDALRLTFCSLATGGRDINFDMKRVEGYRNFCNKLWNASRFIEMQIENSGVSEKPHDDLIEKWINYKFNLTVKKVNDAFESFRFDLATKAIYEFIWYEFCDWYVELSKIQLSKENIDKSQIVKSMVNLLEKTLRLAHPIMPFITEEIWLHFKPFHQYPDESIMISETPRYKEELSDEEYQSVEWLKEIVSGIRNIRGEMLIKPSMKIKGFYQGGDKSDKKRSNELTNLIKESAGLESLDWINSNNELPPSATVVVQDLKILIPLEGLIDPIEESKRLTKKIEKISQEHKMLSLKLNNKKFIDKAPKDLVKDQQDRFDLISKELNNLEGQLKEISRLS
ncbi:MAG: valine--tRNA ligase [Flammeovirgaceae bacterium]|jgi:valyl-tRNA synthetase|nr:valine--tRNA ligase [Flammeovirgaceae bacterium]